MIIVAKYPGQCPSCTSSISVGERLEWNKGRKAVHAACAGGRPVAAGPLSVDGQPAQLGQHWSSRGRGPVVRLCAGGCGRAVRAGYAECYSCHRDSVDAM